MMNDNLLKALLSMDSYNRGYDAGIAHSSISLGNTTIATAINEEGETITLDSGILVDDDGNRLDETVGFYAITYNLPEDEQGNVQQIISFRGTDTAPDPGAAIATLNNPRISMTLINIKSL